MFLRRSGRAVAVVVLVLLAGWCVYMSWGGLRNLFADYQDSPAWVYLIFGGFWLSVAAFFLFVAGRLHRRRSR